MHTEDINLTLSPHISVLTLSHFLHVKVSVYVSTDLYKVSGSFLHRTSKIPFFNFFFYHEAEDYKLLREGGGKLINFLFI